MIFASLDSYCDTGDRIVGRAVANREFLKALMKMDPFSEYHFFLGDSFDRQNFKKYNDYIFRRPDLKEKVRIYYRHQLPHMISVNEYLVFHQSDFITHMAQLASLRSAWSKRPFLITGITHSLSYQRFMSDYSELLLSRDIMVSDAIIGTSMCGIEALKKIFNQLEKKYENLCRRKIGYHGRFDHIPLGVDTEFFIPMDRIKARNKLKLPVKGKILLCLGRFSPASKMDLFPVIRAFKDILKKETTQPVYMVLAGASDGTGYPEALKKLSLELKVKDQIIFLPDFTEKDKPFLYGASDVFISMSDNLQETFGLTVIEAMSCARPVVVSDFSGYRELVSHGNEGFLIPTLWAPVTKQISETAPLSFDSIYHLQTAQSICVDMPSMVQQVLRLIKNPDLSRKMGINGRKKCRSVYDWKSIVNQYLSVWNNLYGFALNTRPNRVKTNNLFLLDYYHAFSHYPSRLLDDTAVVEITEYGKKIYYGKKNISMYDELEDLIEMSMLHKILFLAQRYSSTSELVDKLKKGRKITKENIYYYLMWMTKHGLLNIY